MDRMDRLVTQMLALSRLESTDRLPQAQALQWAPLVEQVISDVLPLAERRRIELDCEWPAAGTPPMPLQGDADLMAVLLRNLLDNAVRYAPEGSTVRMRFGAERLAVENDGAALPAETCWPSWASASAASMARPKAAAAWACRSCSALPRCMGWAALPRADDGQGVVAELGPDAMREPPCPRTSDLSFARSSVVSLISVLNPVPGP